MTLAGTGLFAKEGLIEPQHSRMLVNAFNVRLDSDYDVKPTLNKALAEDILLWNK